MSPPKRNTTASSTLDRYRRQERDHEEQDGDPPPSPTEHTATDTAKVLKAISACQSLLTTKIEEIRVDISLIRQDMTKLRDPVKDTETRISQAKDILHPLQHSHEEVQHQLQQLAQKQNDLENRARRSNLCFIGLPEGAEGPDPATFLEKLLIKTYNREALSTTFVVERAHRMPARRPPEGAPPRTFIAKLLNYRDQDIILRLNREKGNIPFQAGHIMVFPDFSAEVQKQRARFVEVKRRLRAHHLMYAILFPARLRIVGEDRAYFLEDPTLASAWLDQRCGQKSSRLMENNISPAPRVS